MIALPARPASDLPPRLDPKEEALLRALSRLPGLVARVAENGSST